MKTLPISLLLSLLFQAGLAQKTSYNDHQRGASRVLQYRPDSLDFVSVNGKNRYTRALYGGPTAFRLETSDRPVFAAYIEKNSQHISMWIDIPGKRRQALDSTAFCESRYHAGKRTYRLTDPAWGRGELLLTVLALYDGDGAIWKITSRDMPVGTTITAGLTRIRAEKLSRSGDMGADPPGVFEARDNPVFTSTCQSGVDGFILLRGVQLTAGNEAALFRTTAQQCAALASRIWFNTPDPFINPIGGALAAAADGIWDGKSWLHGAIGWRMPLTGWRAAYTGDFLGWHDRARQHFDGYAASQVTNLPNTIPHPAQDTALNMARAVKRWGTPMYSNGYIARNPDRPDQMHHYDMNLVYIDALLWHLNWTGDLDYARQMWPVIMRHLAWEKRNFDPDDDGLYDAYACIWASDGMYYNSGAVTYASAYNYRANKMAGEIAELIGEDPAPYRQAAAKTLAAINARLWMPDRKYWAEYQDFMGLKRLHKSPGVYTIYHTIDSEVPDALQAYEATFYIDREIPHIPVRAVGLTDEGYATISTSSWMPYTWSTNNVAFAEVMHTALAYFQAGRKEEGFRLLKSSVLDGMYLGDSPGNFGQISFYDAARGECYRDFGDAIGVAARVFIQGLYGIKPDALHNRLVISPGFPAAWPFASLHTPDIDLDYKKEGLWETYHISTRFPRAMTLELLFPGRKDTIKKVLINGQPAPRGAVIAPSTNCDIIIEWAGNKEDVPLAGSVPEPGAPLPFTKIMRKKCTPVVMDHLWNAKVTDIFRNEYRTPRSPYTTLAIPIQGIGEWTHPRLTAEINDSGLRALVRDTVLVTNIGIPFRTPATGRNIAFTSLWDNYPDSIHVPLSGKASHAYLLLAGSTNAMQSRIANGRITIVYTDGSRGVTELVNPESWCPIEQDYFIDDLAFKMRGPRPYRVHFKTGLVSNDLGHALGITGVYGREIPGGAGMLLDIRVDPNKQLKDMVVETLSNDVVIGVMSVTLQR
jgi:hypothetical protein